MDAHDWSLLRMFVKILAQNAAGSPKSNVGQPVSHCPPPFLSF